MKLDHFPSCTASGATHAGSRISELHANFAEAGLIPSRIFDGNKLAGDKEPDAAPNKMHGRLKVKVTYEQIEPLLRGCTEMPPVPSTGEYRQFKAIRVQDVTVRSRRLFLHNQQ